MAEQSDGPVVVATPTVMDGTVVRWYRSMAAAERHDRASVSASRHRVSVHDDEYQTLPQEWVRLAVDVHRQLARNPDAKVGHVVTHRYEPGYVELVPVRTEA